MEYILEIIMGKYTLPEMPYAYDALEPHIDARTMEIHHTKHHQTYTDKLNAALETCPAEIQEKDIIDILSDINSVPEDKKGAINFNGGGYDNHRLFWNNMKAMEVENLGDQLLMQSMILLEASLTSKRNSHLLQL